MKNKRKYIKRNDKYWSSLAKKNIQENFLTEDFTPEILGDPFYISSASYKRSSDYTSRTSSRINNNAKSFISDQYSNINELNVPFDYTKNGIANIKEPIMLCQKAYFHIPVFKNTIDILSELSDTSISITGGTKASREFVKKWMESINIENLKSQFFREYYRSGNVFLYRMFAKFSAQEIATMKTIYAKNYELIPQDSGFPKNSLPMRYVILNPMDIVNYESIGTTTVYKKILTKFEAIKLKTPQTEEEKRILEKIKQDNTKTDLTHLDANEVYIDLEPNRMIYVFYKKQDYEPFSVPFGFSVLKDINWKLELKKIDQSISRSLENIILLITMGTEPEKGGINPKNLEAMKQLFSSESIGRVLVADYTTKAEFVIPKLDNILTKQKYEIVNQDIREGLQNILFEEAKYSNSEIKTKIFFEKLKEGRDAFLKNFLQPEIKKICSAIGFRDFPKVKFKTTNMLNEVETQKAAMRLIELGVLDANQGIESINSKELPDSSEIGAGQEKYINERREGLFTPLVGGVPLYEGNQENNNTSDETPPNNESIDSNQKSKNNRRPVKNLPSASGRPSNNSIAKEKISVKSIQEIAKKASKFENFAQEYTKKLKQIKSLSEEQSNSINEMCKSIIESNEICDWEKTFKLCLESISNLDLLKIKSEVLEIAEEYNVDTYQASMIYHSKK